MAHDSSPFSNEDLENIYSQIKEKNFYDVLNIKPTASSHEITSAFHEQAVHFHPDQYDLEGDTSTLEVSKKIYTKIVDAYRTLSNDTKKRIYDDRLHGREDLQNSTTNVAPKRKNSPGDRFFNLARQAFKADDLRTAKMNIQIALTSDASNPIFLHLEQKIDVGLNRRKA